MKKMFFALLLFSASFRAFSQCSPDTMINLVGFYPMDTLLPCIEQGIYYNETLLFKNFSQVTIGGLSVLIISVRIDSVNNMPSGLSYTCNTPDCFYTTGENGCVQLSGTTTAAPGVYNLGFYATLNVSINGAPPSTIGADSLFLAQNGLGYRLVVTNQGGVCLNAEPGQLFFNASINAAVYCEGDTVPFHTLASGGATPYTYSWNPEVNLSDPGIANPLLYPTNPGMYHVTVTDDNGLMAVDSVTVEYSESPQISLTSDATICEGESVQLVASGGTNYAWSPSDGLSADDIANPLASPDQTTTYTVTVSVGNCSGTADVTVAIDNSAPEAAFTPIKTNLDVLFSNTSTGAVSYQWDFGDGNTSSDESPQHRYSQSGNYEAALIATNDCGVSDTLAQMVNLSVGIAGVMNDKMLKVFPNPGTGVFQLKLEDLSASEISVEVTSVCGELVKAESFARNYNAVILLDMTGFPGGVYFLKVASDNRAGFRKIVLE